MILTAANELEGLHDEFDLTDAARPELDVVGELAPLDLALDQRFHLAQALEDAIVEVAPIDERPHRSRIDLGVAFGCRHGARLDPGVALPVTAVALQILLERVEARDERTACAERPQPHIDAEYEALVGARLEHPDQALAEAGEEFFVGDGPRSVGLTMLRKEKDQIDVGGEVELPAAELAHRDDDERLNLP